jgi:hypothetical protein
MKRHTMAAVAVTLIFAGAAHAQSFSDRLIDQFSEQGFTRVEVKNGPTQTKVEAIRGTEIVEVIYDRETGQIIKQETETVRQGDDQRPGFEIRDRNRDFVDAGSSARREDDDGGDDHDSDRDDDSNDDHDDDHDDDHGSDSDHGRDEGDDDGDDSSDD